MREIGERVKAARLAAGLSVVQASKRAGLARDTWKKIEEGESVQDAKRHQALDLLGLTTADAAPAPDDVNARLANLDRQVDALWRRLDELTAQDEGQAAEPRTARPTDELLQRRLRGESSTMPPPPSEDEAAAHDPGVPSEKELRDAEQDAAYDIDQDPRAE